MVVRSAPRVSEECAYPDRVVLGGVLDDHRYWVIEPRVQLGDVVIVEGTEAGCGEFAVRDDVLGVQTDDVATEQRERLVQDAGLLRRGLRRDQVRRIQHDANV